MIEFSLTQARNFQQLKVCICVGSPDVEKFLNKDEESEQRSGVHNVHLLHDFNCQVSRGLTGESAEGAIPQQMSARGLAEGLVDFLAGLGSSLSASPT